MDTFRNLSNTKGSELLERMRFSPEIGAENQTYARDLLDMAAGFIIEYCQFRSYPELSKGYTRSAVSPASDLTGLATNKLLVSVNGSGFYDVELDLSACTTGAATAAELQSKIRQEWADIAGFDEVVVDYDSSSGAEYYTITSGRYGEGSVVGVAFTEEDKHVAQAMKLSKVFGGTVHYGGVEDRELDDACVLLARAMYARMGAEGIDVARMNSRMEMEFSRIDPTVHAILTRRRRLWK